MLNIIYLFLFSLTFFYHWPLSTPLCLSPFIFPSLQSGFSFFFTWFISVLLLQLISAMCHFSSAPFLPHIFCLPFHFLFSLFLFLTHFRVSFILYSYFSCSLLSSGSLWVWKTIIKEMPPLLLGVIIYERERINVTTVNTLGSVCASVCVSVCATLWVARDANMAHFVSPNTPFLHTHQILPQGHRLSDQTFPLLWCVYMCVCGCLCVCRSQSVADPLCYYTLMNRARSLLDLKTFFSLNLFFKFL